MNFTTTTIAAAALAPWLWVPPSSLPAKQNWIVMLRRQGMVIQREGGRWHPLTGNKAKASLRRLIVVR